MWSFIIILDSVFECIKIASLKNKKKQKTNQGSEKFGIQRMTDSLSVKQIRLVPMNQSLDKPDHISACEHRSLLYMVAAQFGHDKDASLHYLNSVTVTFPKMARCYLCHWAIVIPER